MDSEPGLFDLLNMVEQWVDDNTVPKYKFNNLQDQILELNKRPIPESASQYKELWKEIERARAAEQHALHRVANLQAKLLEYELKKLEG